VVVQGSQVAEVLVVVVVVEAAAAASVAVGSHEFHAESAKAPAPKPRARREDCVNFMSNDYGWKTVAAKMAKERQELMSSWTEQNERKRR